jgi:hypothetical protein
MTTSRIVEPQYQAAPQRTETFKQKAPVGTTVSRLQGEFDNQLRPSALNKQPEVVHARRQPEQDQREPIHTHRDPDGYNQYLAMDREYVSNPQTHETRRQPEHYQREAIQVHRTADSYHQRAAKDQEYSSHRQTHETRPVTVRQSEGTRREPPAISSNRSINTSTLRKSEGPRKTPQMITSIAPQNRSASQITSTRHPPPEPSDAVSYDINKPARPISPIHAISRPAPNTTVSQIHTIPQNASNTRRKSAEALKSNPLGPSRGHSVEPKPRYGEKPYEAREKGVRSGPGNVTFGESEKAAVQGNYMMQEGDKVVEMRRGDSRVISESKYKPDGKNKGDGRRSVSFVEERNGEGAGRGKSREGQNGLNLRLDDTVNLLGGPNTNVRQIARVSTPPLPSQMH